MATVLYPDFLENATSYDTVEALWKGFLDSLAIPYTPYINIFLLNGEKERDGNPIFSALVTAQNRGVRIIQYAAEEAQDFYISGWLDTFELAEDKPPIDELVIDLVLSTEAKAIAERWIKAWLVNTVDKQQINALIKQQMMLVE